MSARARVPLLQDLASLNLGGSGLPKLDPSTSELGRREAHEGGSGLFELDTPQET
jgi:hypothetical protein